MARRTENGTGRRSATAVLLTLLAASAAWAEGLQPGVPADAPIWTDRPVRIDRKAQAYERVVVERGPPSWRIRIASQVAVFDSGSFRQDGRVYVLTGAVAVDPKRLCRGEGHIAACGQQARLYLKRLITNRTLDCLEDYRAGDLSLVTCRLKDQDLAATLVEKGAAWAATAALAPLQAGAVERGAGIWTDTQCRASGRCLPEKRRR